MGEGNINMIINGLTVEPFENGEDCGKLESVSLS